MPPSRDEEIAHAPQPQLSKRLRVQTQCPTGAGQKIRLERPVLIFKSPSATRKVCMCRFCTHTAVVSMPLAEMDGHSLIEVRLVSEAFRLPFGAFRPQRRLGITGNAVWFIR